MPEPIEISNATRRRGASPAASRSPAIRAAVHDCRALAIKGLNSLLAGMFDQVDDTLFEMADKSGNNADQTRYFDAMREVRLKRADMERRFTSECGQNFERDPSKADGPATVAQSQGSSFDLGGSLSLVANDELEESLAIDNMVAKIEATCVAELFALDQRMAALLDAAPPPHSTNPVAPKRLCEAFREANGEIDAGIDVKLLILKLFDKFVASELADFYRGLNTYLIGKGILPVIGARAAPVRRVTRNSAARGKATIADASVGFPSAESHNLQRALGPSAAQDGALWQGATSNGAGAFTHTGDQPCHNGSLAYGNASPAQAYASAHDLLAMLDAVMTSSGATDLSAQADHGLNAGATLQSLTNLQQAVGGGAGGEAAQLFEPGRLAAGTTNILRELKNSTVGNDMGRVDSMMIDIVAMLFDGILDDGAIPRPMKGLIGRLQIPVLKVAIIDKTFFSRKFHPARKLLNSVAAVAMGGTDELDDNCPVYTKVDSVVRRILDEFDDDVRIFAEAAAELEKFRADEQRQAASLLEQSLQDIQAQERLRFARQIAAEHIAQRLDGDDLPNIVREFLQVYWKSLLQLAYIDGGEEGDSWSQGIATMDDLIWSLSPPQDADERGRLKSILATLPGRLKSGMSRVPMAEEFRNRLLSTLMRLHVAALKADGNGESPPTHPAAIPQHQAFAGDEPEQIAQADDEQAEPFAIDVDALAATGSRAGCAAADDVGFFDPTGGDLQDSDATIERCETDADDDVRLLAAVARANQIIFDTAQNKPECEGMGTTVVAAQFTAEQITMVHVGDSRLYRLREDRLEQLTSDHSLRQELVNQGFLTPEEAKTSQRKNYITRAVGIDTTVRPDTRSESLSAGDLYLLCSDGLCDLVDDEDIAALLLRDRPTLIEAAHALVNQANANGGKDNISVILVRVAETVADVPAWEMVCLSDVGCTRSHNEDSVECDIAAGLAVLADGMGGYNAGEVASALAVETILSSMRGSAATVDVAQTCASREPAESTAAGFDEDDSCATIVLDAESFPPIDEAWQHDSDEGVEEITIHDVGDSPTAVVEDEHLIAARQLKIGNWVEFQHNLRNSVRARLTWISAATGTYLFTNREGHKVVDTTPQGLAVEFRRGSARHLETVPLFDRALSSLMDRLHSTKSESKSAT